MLKFFFDRFSKIVYLMEVLGLAFTLGWIWKLVHTRGAFLTKILFAIYIAEYLFLRFCDTKRWHPAAKRYEGLELHFRKIMIPVSYILAITSGVGFFTGSGLLLWLAIPFMGVMFYANATLLYLHGKDKNKTPINYFSGKKK
ncbi:MAG: hypothetical protein Q8P84_07205 [Deltaproteobacteria bacterium]|nr:hypothetical protein [Deltaproteobacteria bacterium]